MTRIRELRLEKGIKQDELANMINVTQACISSWELGKSEPSIEALKQLSIIFKVNIDYIVMHADEYGLVEIRDKTLTEKQISLLKKFDSIDNISQTLVLGYITALTDIINK